MTIEQVFDAGVDAVCDHHAGAVSLEYDEQAVEQLKIKTVRKYTDAITEFVSNEMNNPTSVPHDLIVQFRNVPDAQIQGTFATKEIAEQAVEFLRAGGFPPMIAEQAMIKIEPKKMITSIDEFTRHNDDAVETLTEIFENQKQNHVDN